MRAHAGAIATAQPATRASRSYATPDWMMKNIVPPSCCTETCASKSNNLLRPKLFYHY